MKYFTPRLYARLNSSNARTSLAAHAGWEEAEARYEARLKVIRATLPKPVRLLADELCLHDALFLGCLPLSADRTVINVRTDNSLFELSYHLQRPVASSNFALGAVFINQQPRWLYDEVDLIKPGVFSHEILLSNGQVLKCVFDLFDVRASEIRPVAMSAISNGSKSATATQTRG